MSNISNSTAENPKFSNNAGLKNDAISDKTPENVLTFSSFYSSHKAIPSVIEQVQQVEIVDNQTNPNINSYGITKYNSMEGSDQFLMAVAEATEHLDLKNNTLIETLQKVIQGRFLISLISEQPVAVDGSSTRVGAAAEQSSPAKVPVKIEIRTVSRQEHDLSNPKVRAAVEKLLSYQGKIEYQTAKGRAAKPVDEWMQVTFIDTGKMSDEDVALIPMWAYQKFDHRLARAFHNARRYQHA